ncbi:MAG TPA: phage tail protein [Pyrinomonadaceae bacterium]
MSTPARRFTSANRYKVEIDGFPAIFATSASIPETTGTLHKHQAGNETAPTFGPATWEVGEFSFRHATAQGNVDVQLSEWFLRVHEQGVVDKRNARLVIYSHDGRTPLRTWQLNNCLPTSIKPEDHEGESDRTSEFTFAIKPERFRLL